MVFSPLSGDYRNRINDAAAAAAPSFSLHKLSAQALFRSSLLRLSAQRDRQTERQMDRQTERQIERQIERQTERQAGKNTERLFSLVIKTKVVQNVNRMSER